MNTKVAAFVLMTIMTIATLALVNIANFVFADKNPQADCINRQNENFIDNKQSGDTYNIVKIHVSSCQSD